MSLNWQWSDKMGEVTFTNGTTDNLYQGNCLMIAVAETDNMYQLTWFASDRDHLRNMLGLTKGHENCFDRLGITKLRLITRYESVPTIVSDFAKAKVPITIELYHEKAPTR